RKMRAERRELFRAHAAHGEDGFVARFADRLHAAEGLEQSAASFRTNAFDAVELGFEAPLLADAFPPAVRKAVGLVASAGEQDELGALRTKRKRIFLTG